MILGHHEHIVTSLPALLTLLGQALLIIITFTLTYFRKEKNG